jgi:arsenical pump membrane protein
MRIALIGAALLAAGAVALATGALPVGTALELADRVWPILLFAVAVTIVAELAAEAGLFTAIAARLARVGRGRAVVLWLLVVVLALASTIFLSLDTTAVLLTPVVVALARANGLSPLPFAITTVWLANTGSLLLPVSNLTNLLAQHRIGLAPAEFAALMAAPALVAAIVPVAIIGLVFRRELTAGTTQAPPPPVADRPLLVLSAVVLALLLPLFVSGLPVWIPAVAAAAVLGVATAIRRPRAIRPALVPWGLVLFASGLFLAVEALHSLGATAFVGALAGTGETPLDLLRLAGLGALAANAIDNLPAYLLLEPDAASPARIAALLVGVNAGPLVTPWASLATLLWHDRLRALGVELPWSRYVVLGLVAAPLTVGLAALALAATV